MSAAAEGSFAGLPAVAVSLAVPRENPRGADFAAAARLAADVCEQLERNLKFDLLKAEFVGDPDANRLRSRAMRPPWCV